MKILLKSTMLKKRIKISDNFYLDEFVCPEIYQIFKKKSIWFIRPEIIAINEFLRSRHGACTINTWGAGGGDKYSALRPFNCRIGAAYSEHKFGGATDSSFANSTADEVREDIITNWKTLYRPLGLTTIEANVSWVHIDIRHIPAQEEIFIVYS